MTARYAKRVEAREVDREIAEERAEHDGESTEMVIEKHRFAGAYISAAMERAWTRRIDGAWFSTVPGLDGAWGDGDTPEQARAELREALAGWLAVKWRFGQRIPRVPNNGPEVPTNVQQSDGTL